MKGAHSIRLGGDYTRVNLDKKFPQIFNGQLFFVNGCLNTDETLTAQHSDLQKWLRRTRFSFGGGGVFNHQYRNNNFGFFVQDDWKARSNLTLNLGFRTEIMGAFKDNLCHIGNFDPRLGQQQDSIHLYTESCANKLDVAGLTGSGSSSTLKNDYSTGLGPRVGFAWDVLGRHHTTLRGGYGIYYVREDVGTADQLSFQAPYPADRFGARTTPGCLSTFFLAGIGTSQCPERAKSQRACRRPASLIPETSSPAWALYQDFLERHGASFRISAAPTEAPALCPPNSCSLLTVPRHFVTPNTQQWNLTVQRDLGEAMGPGNRVRGHARLHLRETRTNVQAQARHPDQPADRDRARWNASSDH